MSNLTLIELELKRQTQMLVLVAQRLERIAVLLEQPVTIQSDDDDPELTSRFISLSDMRAK